MLNVALEDILSSYLMIYCGDIMPKKNAYVRSFEVILLPLLSQKVLRLDFE